MGKMKTFDGRGANQKKIKGYVKKIDTVTKEKTSDELRGLPRPVELGGRKFD